MEHARWYWRMVASSRGVDANREATHCPLTSFDIQDNLVMLHPNANGIIKGEFPHE